MKSINENIKSILALIIVTMTYVIFVIILLKHATNDNAVSQVLIAVTTGFGTMGGYYYGYSKGASQKDDTIANMINTTKTDPPNTTITNNIS